MSHCRVEKIKAYTVIAIQNERTEDGENKEEEVVESVDGNLGHTTKKKFGKEYSQGPNVSDDEEASGTNRTSRKVSDDIARGRPHSCHNLNNFSIFHIQKKKKVATERKSNIFFASNNRGPTPQQRR